VDSSHVDKSVKSGVKWVSPIFISIIILVFQAFFIQVGVCYGARLNTMVLHKRIDQDSMTAYQLDTVGAKMPCKTSIGRSIDIESGKWVNRPSFGHAI